jgi:anti-sigma factor RsiW
MATIPDIHNDTESWLAAAVHDQLSPEERAQFNEHLATCETCRALHQEELTINTMIESTLEEAKPDLAFEQRILSSFRRKVPQRAGLTSLLAALFRLRATSRTRSRAQPAHRSLGS